MASDQGQSVGHLRKFEVIVEVPVIVTVHDGSVIARCVENHDENGVPVPLGSNGWRDNLYNLDTAERVAEHLAYNWLVNDATYNRLDGWADLAGPADTEAPAVEYRIDRHGIEFETHEVEASHGE